MEYILIGKINNTFGIRGELKVEVYTDFVKERFKKDSLVYVGKDKKPFTVKTGRYHGDVFLLSFKDHEDINLVEKYKGQEIFKSSDDIAPLKEGEYYFRDLRGLKVLVEGEEKGVVADVEEGLRNNFIRVRNGDKETLVPFLPVFIEAVDLKAGVISVKKMEGLL